MRPLFFLSRLFILFTFDCRRKKYEDVRTRRDRVENRNKGFGLQLSKIVDAYLEWQLEIGDAGLDNAGPPAPVADDKANGLKVQVVDIFRELFINGF